MGVHSFAAADRETLTPKICTSYKLRVAGEVVGRSPRTPHRQVKYSREEG